MSVTRSVRSVAVVAASALVLGAFFALPAEAKKKKKKKKKPSVVVNDTCAPYTPSSWGEGLDVSVLTDKNTEADPLVLEVPVAAGAGSTGAGSPDGGQGAASHSFVNVQTNSKAASTGFYATIEYDVPVFDYDLWIRGNDGAGIAYSAGFLPGVPFLDGTGNGGATGVGSENVSGLTTDDCTGYLVDIAGATTPGETVTLKMWLGEATYTPSS